MLMLLRSTLHTIFPQFYSISRTTMVFSIRVGVKILTSLRPAGSRTLLRSTPIRCLAVS